jgi:hypothetical protein
MITYYCPSCWAEFGENVSVCPRCGYDIRSFSDLEYEQKLMRAAFHPIPENRHMAVMALGMLRTPRALPVLGRILREEKDDIYLLFQVLKAAANIPDPRSMDLLEEGTRHSYRLVRERARQLLGKGYK